MKVLVKYNFIFDPAETWGHRSSFEEALGRMFQGLDLRAEVVETGGDEEKAEKYVFITKKPMVEETETEKPKRERTVNQAKAYTQLKRDENMKFKK